MEEAINHIAIIRSTIYLALVSLSIVSAMRLFRKLPLFRAGLTIALMGALFTAVMSTLSTRVEMRILSAVVLTVCLSVWVLLWAIEYAEYEKE